MILVLWYSSDAHHILLTLVLQVKFWELYVPINYYSYYYYKSLLKVEVLIVMEHNGSPCQSAE